MTCAGPSCEICGRRLSFVASMTFLPGEADERDGAVAVGESSVTLTKVSPQYFRFLGFNRGNQNARNLTYVFMPTTGSGAIIKSALEIAVARAGVGRVPPVHIFSSSTAAVGNIEQIILLPCRLKTNGQQIVAPPMVAASKGTGIV